MTHLQSSLVSSGLSCQDLYEQLSDMNNLQKLMPPQVNSWTGDKDSCHFQIEGMGGLGLKFRDKTIPSLLVMEQNGKAPFSFLLKAEIFQTESGSDIRFSMEADLNPFIKMMAEKPLRNFLEVLAVAVGAGKLNS